MLSGDEVDEQTVAELQVAGLRDAVSMRPSTSCSTGMPTSVVWPSSSRSTRPSIALPSASAMTSTRTCPSTVPKAAPASSTSRRVRVRYGLAPAPAAPRRE